MSEGIENPVEKTEKTIEGIVYAFGAYFRTLAALALPFFLRERKLLAPPLLFLSISTFLFSIAVVIIDSAEFNDVRTILSGFKARANLDISITHLLSHHSSNILLGLAGSLGRTAVGGGHSRAQRALQVFLLHLWVFRRRLFSLVPGEFFGAFRLCSGS